MRFVDEAKVQIVAGHGGRGCVSFRRETFVPRGGPDGGEGGRGGDVIFEANENLTTLQDFRVRRVYRGKNGAAGSGNNRAGKSGTDQLVKVPVGTQLFDAVTGELLFDLDKHGTRTVICKGGRGGKGNAHFVTSTFQAPRFAQPGEEGEIKSLRLELKLMADVGLLGLPNAGKSTLLSRISSATPKIASYPFTTLSPVLGVVSYSAGGDPSDSRQLVVADIPGLIEGASTGAGLGHQFLRHVSRTRCLLHLVSTESGDPDSMIRDIGTLENELRAYDATLLDRPRIIVLTKWDLWAPGSPERHEIQQALNTLASARQVIPISAATGENISELLEAMSRLCFRPNSETIAVQ